MDDSLLRERCPVSSRADYCEFLRRLYAGLAAARAAGGALSAAQAAALVELREDVWESLSGLAGAYAPTLTGNHVNTSLESLAFTVSGLADLLVAAAAHPAAVAAADATQSLLITHPGLRLGELRQAQLDFALDTLRSGWHALYPSVRLGDYVRALEARAGILASGVWPPHVVDGPTTNEPDAKVWAAAVRLDDGHAAVSAEWIHHAGCVFKRLRAPFLLLTAFETRPVEALWPDASTRLRLAAADWVRAWVTSVALVTGSAHPKRIVELAQALAVRPGDEERYARDNAGVMPQAASDSIDHCRSFAVANYWQGSLPDTYLGDHLGPGGSLLPAGAVPSAAALIAMEVYLDNAHTLSWMSCAVLLDKYVVSHGRGLDCGPSHPVLVGLAGGWGVRAYTADDEPVLYVGPDLAGALAGWCALAADWTVAGKSLTAADELLESWSCARGAHDDARGVGATADAPPGFVCL